MASFLGPLASGLLATFCVFLIFRFAVSPEPVRRGSRRVIAYSRGMKIVTILLGGVALFILYAASQARADQQFMAALVSLTLAAGYVWLALEVFFTQISTDEDGFDFKNLFGKRRVSWAEIVDGGGPNAMGYYLLRLESGKRVQISAMVSGLEPFFKKIESQMRARYPERFVPDEHALNNRPEIERSTMCGCFCCLEIFPARYIQNWLPPEASGRADTAICPACGQYGVLGDVSGYPITPESLQKVRDYISGFGG